jgi:tripartite-type tricarboxylate transporter receptor subunit TctC
MVHHRRGWFSLCGASAVFLAAAGNLAAQTSANYPIKPVRVVVGVGAGSGADVTARSVAHRLTEPLGQTVVVENRPGASGAIGAELVARAPADGYTLLLATAADTVQPALRANLPYDVTRDFAPVSMLSVGPLLLVVNASLPVKNVKELIALARTHPGKVSFGSTGVGTMTHLAAELFKHRAQINIVHVPFKSGAESAVATASGQIEMTFPSIPAALPLMEARKLRALAISGDKRVAIMPAVATFDELGLKGYDRSSWYGMLAPAGTPRDVIARLNTAVTRVLAMPQMKETMNRDGTEPRPTTPEQFAAFIARELAQNAELIRAMGLKAE